MSEVKLSNTALESSLRRANGLAKDAGTVYKLTRNLVFTLGLTATIFLPLASNQQQPTLPPVTVELPPINLPKIEVPDVTLVPSDDWHLSFPTVDVKVLTTPIQGSPPMSRDWHRTTFRQTGDQFWALPDANFIMRFTADPQFSGCAGIGCAGTFEVTERGGGSLFNFNAPINGALTTRSPACNIGLTPVFNTQTLRCKITVESGPYCVELRRTEHPETEIANNARQLKTDVLALDIRWQRWTDTNCQQN